MSGEFEFEGHAPDDGWSKVPHGLWTADLAPSARLLLGWLHSHHPGYRSRLSVRRIRDEFGAGGSVDRLLKELEEAGFVRRSVAGPRKASRIIVDVAAYFALVRKPDASAPIRAQTAPIRGSSAPDRAHIEEQVGDQEEDHLPTVAIPANLDDPRFVEFWKNYPRNEGKPSARRAFTNALKRSSFEIIMNGLAATLPVFARRSADRVPMPATWLNDDRFLTPPPMPSSSTGRAPGGVQQTVDMGRRIMAEMERDQRAIGGE